MIAGILAAALAMSLAAVGAQTWRLDRLQSQVADERAAAAELARTTERQLSARTQEIDRAAQARLLASRAAADAARGDADGLRHALAARTGADPAAAGCAAERAAADRLAGLLDAAAGLAAECQARGGALADQVIGLQDYAVRVCTAEASGASISRAAPTPLPRR